MGWLVSNSLATGEVPWGRIFFSLSCFCMLVVWRSVSSSLKEQRNSPPGLPGWLGPLGGHLGMIKDLSTIHTYLEYWHKHFGGEYDLNIGGYATVCVTNPVDVAFVLSKRPKVFRRWEALQAVSKGLEKSVFGAEGEEWGMTRRLISSGFLHKNIRVICPTVNEMVRRMLGVWAAAPGGRVDAKESFTTLFTATTVKIGFSHDLRAFTDDPDTKTSAALEAYFGVMQSLLFDPLFAMQWKVVPEALSFLMPRKKAFLEADAYVEHLMQTFLDAARTDKDGTVEGEKQHGDGVKSTGGGDGGDEATDGGTGVLLRKMVQQVEQADRKKLSAKEQKAHDTVILHQLKSFLVAGRDTTGATCAFAVSLLAANPDKQRKLQRELDSMLGPSPGALPDSFEQLEALRYTKAVVHETLRLYGPASNLAMQALSDTTLPSGRVRPKGSVVFCLLGIIARDEANFSRPLDFVPERWLSQEEREEALLALSPRGAPAVTTTTVNHKPQHATPFGGGVRRCPGQEMAQLEAVAALAGIFKRFDVRPDETKPKTRAVTSFALGPDQVHVIVKNRE